METNLKDNKLIRAFAPLHTTHLVFGFRYKRTRDERTDLKQLVRLASKGHFVLISISCWLNFGRFFMVYDKDDVWGPDLVSKILYHIFLLSQTSGTFFALYLSRKSDGFFSAWWKYKTQHGTNTEAFEKRLRKRVLIATTVSVLFIGMVQVMILYDYLSIHGTFARLHLQGIIPENAEAYHPISVILLIINVFFLGAWMMPISYITVICLTFRDEFLIQIREFERKMSINSNSEWNLENHRKRHIAISNIVRNWDSICSTYVMIIFMTNIPFCCLLVYMFVMMSSPDRLEEILVVWVAAFVASLLTMLIITAAGSLLHLSAVAIKATLHKMDLNSERWTDNKRLQYTTFLTRITEGNVGITAWRLFYINKLTTKMIFLMIISYSLILLKFGSYENP